MAIGYGHPMFSGDPPVNAKAVVQSKAMASGDGQPCNRRSGDSGYPSLRLWGKKQSCRNKPHQKQNGDGAMSGRRAAVSTMDIVVLMFTGIAASRAEDGPPRFPKATMEQLNVMVSAVVIAGRIEIPDGGAPPMPVLVK
jgi:hypothetical protein